MKLKSLTYNEKTLQLISFFFFFFFAKRNKILKFHILYYVFVPVVVTAFVIFLLERPKIGILKEFEKERL